MRGYKSIILVSLMFLFCTRVWGQYNPANPAEPGVYYTLTLQATPSNGGSFNIESTTSYSEGSYINLRAYTNTGFEFVAWEQNGEVISTSSSFTYTMPAGNVKLTAHYRYNPGNPSEPTEPNLPIYSTLNLSASPAAGGYFNINSGNRYEVGSTVSLRAYSNSYYTFKDWTENGEIISTSSSFTYVMEADNPTLVANFIYNPSNPAEPTEAQFYRRLYLNCNPSDGGYFNVSSGNEYQEGSVINLRAYSNQWYSFANWTIGDSVISESYNLSYVMPEKDVTLTANYSYNYNPENPNEPDKPSGDQVNIYGMTENGVRGQTIIYPIYLENTFDVSGMVVDVQFPQGFYAQASNVSLSGRASEHEMSVIELGDNSFRFSLLGESAFTGNNGKMFEIPVTIPDTARMGHNYDVTVFHGVMHRTDGSQSPISTRKGFIYVEKISEDGLYARYSYDKLHGRVKFTNLSSSNATEYNWNFGDGTTSTEKNPLHEYAHSGYYTVTLTVKGEYDTDIAEQTVLINDEGSWKIEGTFYLADEEKGVRYFTSPDSLFSFISGSPLGGNVGIAVLANNDYLLELNKKNISILKKIQSELEANSYSLNLFKNGDGRNSVLCFGESGSTIDSEFVDFYINFGKSITNKGIEMQLWGISFDPTRLNQITDQTIYSGNRTLAVDFSSISQDVTYSWILENVPEKVTGLQTSGSGNMPSMTIINEGEGNCNLTYIINGLYNGNKLFSFNYNITVTPALVGLFENLSPEFGAVYEKSTVTLSWNSITNAVYDVYLWNASNRRPQTPVVSGITDLRYTSQNFCQNGSSYKWQIVARNESQEMASDTMYFSVLSLPDLHVYAVDCSEPTAGQKFTIQWTVRNDGKGSTGDIQWNDYVWLVTDVYGGTQTSGFSTNNSTLLATLQNVKALESGESYDNSVDVTLDERIFGNYYLLVTSDMYSVMDVEWSAIGGSVLNPYNPVQDGTGYKHLYATTTASYNKVYEEGETTTYSDNFFYKKIDIAVPLMADLQVPNITAQVIPVGDFHSPDYYTVLEACTPTPLTAAGIAHNSAFYSGKKVKVIATIANKGGASTGQASWRSVLYLSHSPERDDSELIAVATANTSVSSLDPGKSVDVEFTLSLPYSWFGDTWFYVYTDIGDVVYELANTANNWGMSDKYAVNLCPGADLVPGGLSVPTTVPSMTSFDISYSVSNKGAGVPYSNHWKDKIYLSTKNTGIDNSSILLRTIDCEGGFRSKPMLVDPNIPMGSVMIPAEEFSYSGDSYSKKISINPNIASGQYYIYVVIDANNDVFEHDGEENNVLMTGPIRFVQPDLTVELVSISEDTLINGREVALTWKLKNIGDADIKDANITDEFYATVNQTATGGALLGKVVNNVWIAAGQEKTLRTNLVLPDNSANDGLRYIYAKTNTDNRVSETKRDNNTSETIRKWFKYTTEPKVPVVFGANIKIDNISIPNMLRPDSLVTLNYVASNTGDADMSNVDVPLEVYLSNSYDFSIDNSVKCVINKQNGSLSGLKAGKSVSYSLVFTVPANIIGGYKYLHFFADRTNTLGQKDITDNYSRASIFINGNMPDLQITSYSASDTIMTSVDSKIKFTVSNTGEWDAGVLSTTVYLSSDKTLNRSYRQLFTKKTNSLGKGLSEEQTASFTIDDRSAGKWYIIIKTDVDNQQKELDENNNLKVFPVTVVQSPLPDLIVSTLSTDSVLTSGQPLKISTTVTNTGKSATRKDKWSESYYLSTGTVLNTNTAIMLGSKAHVGILEVGKEYSTNASFTIPSNIQGNYILFAVTDATDAICEEDENNNYIKIPIFINGSAATPADLTVSGIDAPSVIKAGEDVTISYKITNVGEFTAAANLHDVIYLSKDDRWDMNDEMVGVVSGNATINPGNTLTRTVTGRIVNVPEGDYYIVVKTNSTRSVAEQNTDNNVGIMNSSSKISFSNINLGSTISTSSGYYKLNVPAGLEGKTVGFYLDHPASANVGLYAAYEQVPSTAKYDFASSALLDTQQEVLIPNAKAGNYYVLAQDNSALVNSTGNVFALNGSHNQSSSVQMTLTVKEINFGATKLSIKEGGNGGWVSTDINGALFDSIMDFRLVLDNTVIPAEAVTFNGMTKSRATFNLNNAEIGTYNVVSELPDGTQATLPDGFKVIPGASVNLSAKIDAPSVVRVGSYAPVAISYANGGNTDCELYDLIVVIDNGYLSTTIEGLDKHESVLHLPIDSKIDTRGYKAISPGTHKTVNIFMYQISNTSNITIYIVK